MKSPSALVETLAIALDRGWKVIPLRTGPVSVKGLYRAEGHSRVFLRKKLDAFYITSIFPRRGDSMDVAYEKWELFLRHSRAIVQCTSRNQLRDTLHYYWRNAVKEVYFAPIKVVKIGAGFDVSRIPGFGKMMAMFGKPKALTPSTQTFPTVTSTMGYPHRNLLKESSGRLTTIVFELGAQITKP
jgi:hypothetical protein